MAKGIKQTIKRGIVKAHRKVFGKETDVMITSSKGGLTKAEIRDVLQTLSQATKQGTLPALNFEFKPPIPILSKREPLFLTPKDGNVLKARVKIREIIKARYGTQFTIDGGKSNPIQEFKGTAKQPRLSSKRMLRITPKRPRLSR